MDVVVVFVEPQFPGNIGSVARAMKNFGFEILRLVNPPEFTDETFRYAKHAKSVVENSKSYSSLGDAIQDAELVVGSTGIVHLTDKKFLRKPVTPRELAGIALANKTVAIVIGRENYGLYNEELALCDLVVHIPTSGVYPVMNVSHALGIILYELHIAGSESSHNIDEDNMAGRSEREMLVKTWSTFLESINYPKHKRKKALHMFTRMLGHVPLSKWEYHMWMGILKQAMYRSDADE